MSTVTEFLTNLRARDIKIGVEDDRLRINAPKGAIDEALKSELSQRKSEIIAYLNAASTVHSKDTLPLIPVDRNTSLPLSFTQQRLWFLDQLEPDSSTYNVPIAMRLTGELNVSALEKSVQGVVDRHEVLRTSFVQEDGRPIQQIASSYSVEMSQVDMREYPADERVDRTMKRIEADVYQPFKLETGPLLRVKLFYLDESDHILLITQHHIVTDRWSLVLMWHEITSIYNELVTGTPASLPELPVQYADYADWQQKWLESEEFEAQLDYWQKQLSSTLPTIDLPLDHPRPVNSKNEGGTLRCILPSELVQNAKQLGQNHGATLFMTILTAFESLLFRYSGQEDMIIGTSIANRNRAETSSLIGFFVNTLLLRTDLSGQPSFIDLLNRVKQVSLEAFANQDMPVEKLIELLQPERDGSRAALFDVLFIFQNTPEAEGKLANLSANRFPLEVDRSMFDLTWYVTEQANELEFTIEYDVELFERETIERMFTHFHQLMESIVATPAEPISLLSMLPTQEQHILNEWGQAKTIPLPEGCVHHWFEAQAKAIPEKTAVSHQTQHLSYAELNARANQLAHYLIENGIEPDTIVGLHIPRSIEMIVALFGILKAGGAYLPLDPTYPESRLQFMVDDAQPAVILTLDDLNFTLSEGQTTQIVQMHDTHQFANYPTHDPKTAVTQDHLAYIIYTSGSTGKPKGVLIEHGAMATFVQGAVSDYPITGDDRVLQFATIAFDTAVEEIYPCLTQGGTLILRTETILHSMETFLDRCADWGITVLDLPTAFWHQLTATIATENLSLPQDIKLVIIGGEKANEQALNQWQQCVNPDVKLLNTYGPTETTVVATMFEANNEVSATTISKGVLIGLPLPNYEVHVLDAALQPVPIGVPGELLIGGSGLARGYLNRPELTDEKFIPNPFNNNPQARLYKSGDLVRYLPDGNIEFMGRVDDQVKIRGFRVELGEIEATISQHPQVRENVVIAWEDEDSRKRLVAYLKLNQESEATISEIRSFLKQNLPDYMIPANFVPLDHLPMTPNGKLDRKALPAPDLTRSEQDHQFVAPRNQIEQTLTQIWSNLLKVENIGIDDNFFELGGDSILSIQIIAKANQAGVRLTPIQIFEHQTIAELAMVAGSSQTIQAEQGEVTGPVKLAPYQEWFFEQGLADPHHWNMAAVLEAKQSLDPALVEKTVQQLIIHHDALRLRFVRQSDNTWQQTNVGVEQSTPVPFTQLDLTGLPASQQDNIMESSFAGWQANLNLENGPLIKVALVLLGPERSDRLLFVIHHMVVDGISLRILLEDFNQIYEQLSNDQTPTLPAKTTSYQQWTNSLTKYAQSETALHEQNYWIEQLEKQVPRLPVDNQTGINIEGSTQSVWVSLSVEDTEALLKEVPAAYNTQINDVLLTALVQSFANWTGSQTLVLDLEGHGRENIIEDVDLSRTVGCFTSLFPVILDLDDVHDQGGSLKSVKEQLYAIPNRGIGYGLLYYLNQGSEISNKLRTLPQAEISFNYLGQFDQTLPASSPFSLIQNATGPVRSPRGMRRYLIDILGIMSKGQLYFNWIFSENLHQRSTIEDLAWDYIDALNALIMHCQSGDAGGYTPSDFPEAKLSQNELDNFLANFNKG